MARSYWLVNSNRSRVKRFIENRNNKDKFFKYMFIDSGKITSTWGNEPPVIAHQSTLWSALGEIDTPIVKNKVSTKIKSHGVAPVIGSEATLWSPLGGN